MFTGIIECVGNIVSRDFTETNIQFGIESKISEELKVDQSLSHNGVCLTVIKLDQNIHFVTAVDETIKKSNLSEWEVGQSVNLERAMLSNGRFDGHIVQGHVDCVATCTSIDEQDGSWVFSFNLDTNHSGLIVEKGSICINGISLTCFNVSENSFSVAIIPYTYKHTTFNLVRNGSRLNIEFDVIGKYVRSIVSSGGT